MRRIWLLWICMLPLFLFGQQYTGLTGLIQVPTAEMAPEGQARIGTHFLCKDMMPNWFNVEGAKYNAPNTYLALTPFPWLELAYTMTFYKGANVDIDGNEQPNDVGFHFKDRYFSVKVQVIKEKKWWPSVALGSNDPITTSDGGNQYFANYFVAVTKHLSIKKHIFAAHLSYRTWKRKDNKRWQGIVGGITYQTPQLPDLRVIAEYTGDGVNVGFDWKLWKHVMVQASLYDAKYFSGGICLYMNLL